MFERLSNLLKIQLPYKAVTFQIVSSGSDWETRKKAAKKLRLELAEINPVTKRPYLNTGSIDRARTAGHELRHAHNVPEGVDVEFQIQQDFFGNVVMSCVACDSSLLSPAQKYLVSLANVRVRSNGVFATLGRDDVESARHYASEINPEVLKGLNKQIFGNDYINQVRKYKIG